MSNVLEEFAHIHELLASFSLRLLDLEIAIVLAQRSPEGPHVLEDPHVVFLLNIPIDLLACPQAHQDLELLVM